MRTFQLNKLVKDTIVELMLAQGQKVAYRTLEDEEYELRIREKVLEEAHEFFDTGDGTELDDLLGIILAAKQVENPKTQLFVETKPVDNVFTKKIFVETVSVQDDSKWAKYYQADPVRFKEIT